MREGDLGAEPEGLHQTDDAAGEVLKGDLAVILGPWQRQTRPDQ